MRCSGALDCGSGLQPVSGARDAQSTDADAVRGRAEIGRTERSRAHGRRQIETPVPAAAMHVQLLGHMPSAQRRVQ